MLEGVELFCCATARFSGIREIVNAICKQHELSHPYLPLHFCKGWKVLSFITAKTVIHMLPPAMMLNDSIDETGLAMMSSTGAVPELPALLG